MNILCRLGFHKFGPYTEARECQSQLWMNLLIKKNVYNAFFKRCRRCQKHQWFEAMPTYLGDMSLINFTRMDL